MCSSHGAAWVSFNGFAQSRARERFGPQRRTADTVIDPSPMAPEPVAAVAEAPTPPPGPSQVLAAGTWTRSWPGILAEAAGFAALLVVPWMIRRW